MVKVGEIYKINHDVCCAYDMESRAAFIKITGLLTGNSKALKYDILDAAQNVIDYCSGCVSESDLIPLDIKLSELKKGDKVEILGANYNGLCDAHIGDIGTFVSIDHDGDCVVVDFPVRSKCSNEKHYFKREMLKPVVNFEAEAKPKVSFKVGDKVRVTGKGTLSCDATDHTGQVGHIEYIYSDDISAKVVYQNTNVCTSNFDHFKLENLELLVSDYSGLSQTTTNATDTSLIPKSMDDVIYTMAKKMLKSSEHLYYGNGIGTPFDIKSQPKPKKSMAKRITNLVKKLVDQETQDLIRVGWLDDDLELTDEGRDAVLERLFLDNKASLAAEAKTILAEEAKTK